MGKVAEAGTSTKIFGFSIPSETSGPEDSG